MRASRLRPCVLVLVCLLPLPLVSCRSTGARIVEGGFDYLNSPEGQALITTVAEKTVDKATDVIVDKVEKAVEKKMAPLTTKLGEYGVAVGEVKTVGDAVKAYTTVREKEKETGKPYEPVTGSLITDILAALVSALIAQRGGGVVMRRFIKDKAAEMIKAGLANAPKPPA